MRADLEALPSRIRERRLKPVLARAEQAERNRRPRDAVKAYEDALRIDPECRPAAGGKQRCDQTVARLAAEDHRRRSRRATESLEAGRRALEEQRLRDALDHFREALKQESSNVEPRNGIQEAEGAVRVAQARWRKRLVLGAVAAAALLAAVVGLRGYLDARALRSARVKAVVVDRDSVRKTHHATSPQPDLGTPASRRLGERSSPRAAGTAAHPGEDIGSAWPQGPKLPEGLEAAFEVPVEAKDQHGNPIRKGKDPEGRQKEARQFIEEKGPPRGRGREAGAGMERTRKRIFFLTAWMSPARLSIEYFSSLLSRWWRPCALNLDQ